MVKSHVSRVVCTRIPPRTKQGLVFDLLFQRFLWTTHDLDGDTNAKWDKVMAARARTPEQIGAT